eukprot:TRINITY_DN7_c0_g1_i1.p1 TRINITY_DN7_c0_g1~~TRINITY_DN7_c0_g1_i1.p1  ORF type:complete len:148 (-),score=22.93 TRINITY_DN7_c0_g1_i1:62-505(-)
MYTQTQTTDFSQQNRPSNLDTFPAAQNSRVEEIDEPIVVDSPQTITTPYSPVYYTNSPTQFSPVYNQVDYMSPNLVWSPDSTSFQPPISPVFMQQDLYRQTPQPQSQPSAKQINQSFRKEPIRNRIFLHRNQRGPVAVANPGGSFTF